MKHTGDIMLRLDKILEDPAETKISTDERMYYVNDALRVFTRDSETLVRTSTFATTSYVTSYDLNDDVVSVVRLYSNHNATTNQGEIWRPVKRVTYDKLMELAGGNMSTTADEPLYYAFEGEKLYLWPPRTTAISSGVRNIRIELAYYHPDARYTKAGTVTATNGSAILSGTGSAFSKLAATDKLSINGTVMTVSNVTSDTVLTMTATWAGTTLTTSYVGASVIKAQVERYLEGPIYWAAKEILLTDREQLAGAYENKYASVIEKFSRKSTGREFTRIRNVMGY